MQSKPLRTSTLPQQPLSNSFQRTALENAVRQQVPYLTMVKSVSFWEHGDWIYVFIVTKVAWEKLRVFGLQRLYRYRDEETGIEVIQDPGLKLQKLTLILTKQKQDLQKITSTFKQGIQSGIFNNLQVTLPSTTTINPISYSQRFKHYDVIRRMLCKLLSTDIILTNKIFIRGHLKIYQLRVTILLLGHRYDVRVVESGDRFRFEIQPSPEGKFGSVFECFPLTEDVDGLVKSLKRLRNNANVYEIMTEKIMPKYGLEEVQSKLDEKEGFISIGAWRNRRRSLHFQVFSDDCIQNVWFTIEFRYRVGENEGESLSLSEVSLKKQYNYEVFMDEIEQFFNRIRLLDESDTVNPLKLLNRLDSFKNSIENKKVVWDEKENHWELFSFYLLDFPIPLHIIIGYDFVTDRIDISSLFLQGDYKHIDLLSESLLKSLTQLKSRWHSHHHKPLQPPTLRFEFPKMSDKHFTEQILSQLYKYDILFVNRQDHYQSALYLGNGNILHLEPSAHHASLTPRQHLKTSKIVSFISNREFIVVRQSQPMKPEEQNVVQERLVNFPEKFVYYGFVNNSDEIVRKIRWGVDGSLETEFFIVVVGFLSERNLMERELLEYVRGLVACKGDEERREFLKKSHYSINKAIKRIKQTCTSQMKTLLSRYDWVFQATIN